MMGFPRPGKRLQFAIENGPVELVDLPINSMVIFSSYVNVYQIVIYLLKILIFHSDVNVYWRVYASAQHQLPHPDVWASWCSHVKNGGT